MLKLNYSTYINNFIIWSVNFSYDYIKIDERDLFKMYKNIKTKIIIVSVLTGLILLGSLSFLYLKSITEIQKVVTTTNSISEVVSEIDVILLQSKTSIIIISALFILVTILISLFLSRFVICPKNKFIRSDERAELKDKLNEVSSRKNQIETILLHMTDGIIAFNMEGEIILINPAAKKFLSISPEDSDFYDIFGKFNLDINMECLGSWTSQSLFLLCFMVSKGKGLWHKHINVSVKKILP